MDAISLMERRGTHWLREKIKSPCLFELFTSLIENRQYSETVVSESGQRTKYTMSPPSTQEEDSTMNEDIYFAF